MDSGSNGASCGLARSFLCSYSYVWKGRNLRFVKYLLLKNRASEAALPMDTKLDTYLSLAIKLPNLFKNTGDPGEIKIILEKDRIIVDQKKIRARLKKDGKPSHWIDIGILAEDEWFYILRDLVEFPDGRVGGYVRWINRKSSEG